MINKTLCIIVLASLSSFTRAMEPSALTLKDILKLQGISKQEILQLNGVKKEVIERIQDKDSAILQITSLLYKEDVADMRLVCREWAPKDKNWKDKPHWTLMPADVEKEHDNIMKKQCKITACDQAIVLFHFTIKNNFAAVQWIRYNTNTWHGIKYGDEWTILPCMVAIHNNKKEIARFLIEANPRYKDNNWKFYYNTIVIPESLQNYLYPHDNRNFSFLFYYIAVVTDNIYDLKKLYTQKIPTKQGQKFLISEAKDGDAVKCLKFLSETKEVVRKKMSKKKNHNDDIIRYPNTVCTIL